MIFVDLVYVQKWALLSSDKVLKYSLKFSKIKGLVNTLIERLRKNEEVQKLFESILGLENIEECNKFFEDICTIHELESMAQRLEVARLLRAGVTYTTIAAQTGASTATISRVNRSLSYGDGGYDIVIKRMEKDNA